MVTFFDFIPEQENEVGSLLGFVPAHNYQRLAGGLWWEIGGHASLLA